MDLGAIRLSGSATQRHVELYYASMAAGLVCHTLNPRLTPQHLAAMINEAEDRVLAVAANLLPLPWRRPQVSARRVVGTSARGSGELCGLTIDSGGRGRPKHRGLDGRHHVCSTTNEP